MANSSNIQNRIRVGGLLTTFSFAGSPIAFCQQVAYQSPQPVGQGASAIQPMDEPHPAEIITPFAAGMGQITLNMFELFGSGGKASKVWDRLGVGQPTRTNVLGAFQNTDFAGGPFSQAADIVDIFIIQAQMSPDQLTVTKYINPLPTTGSQNGQVGRIYTEEYHGCVITNVVDGEQVQVSTLEIIKQVTIAFRYLTRNGDTNKLSFNLRDNVVSPSPVSNAVANAVQVVGGALF